MKPIRLKYAQRDITAARDKNGVPHVMANSWLDALYGLGYLHANDRPTQLVFSRSVASGRATEEIKDSAELLETDRFFRRIGLYRNLDVEFAALSATNQEQLSAYCAGVNDCLEPSWRSLAMWATGFRPTLWDEPSTMLVGQLLSFGGLAISRLQNERLLVELIHAGINDDALRELFEPRLDDVASKLSSRICGSIHRRDLCLHDQVDRG